MEENTALGATESAVKEEAAVMMEKKKDDEDTKAAVDLTAEAQNAKKPSRIKYSRAQLMHIRETNDLSVPPVGYNPTLLRPVEPSNKDPTQMTREGRWNRNRGGKGGMPYNRGFEGGEEGILPPPRGGRALRNAINFNSEPQDPNATGDKGIARRNSRSDVARWDNHKDGELSKSAEKRGSEKWMPYGHRDSKEKPKTGKEDECIENPPQENLSMGPVPPWMHNNAADSAERIKQHRQFAADFEEERMRMREKIAEENKERNTDRGESSFYMTDAEISDYKKQLEAEDRGVSTPYTFDTFKEAIKSQGVSNLPPMPTSGISTVDQIENKLKASAAASRVGQGGGAGAPGNIEGTSLLSMLRGHQQQRQAGGFPGLTPGYLQHSVGGFPMGLQQQQGIFQQGGNSQLEKLFGANQRIGGLGLPNYGAQPMGNVPNIPFMQQAGFNQRGSQDLLAALLANQQNINRQAQMMAHLKQAQRETALKNARDENAGRDQTDEGISQTSPQLPAFGLQSNLMAPRPTLANPQGMLNPFVPPNNLFPGGHPGFFMQNGAGGIGRPMGPNLGGFNLGLRSPMGGMESQTMANPNGNPQALQASLLAGQQTSSGLNRFFGEQNASSLPTDQGGVAPVRNLSSDEPRMNPIDTQP